MIKQRKPIEFRLDYQSKGYEIGEEIGKGGFGLVFACKKLDQPKIYAMKVIHMSIDESQKNDIIKETNILKRFDHSNIIKYIDSFFLDEYFCIVMEYAQEGSLRDMLKENALLKKKVSEEEAYQIFA